MLERNHIGKVIFYRTLGLSATEAKAVVRVQQLSTASRNAPANGGEDKKIDAEGAAAASRKPYIKGLQKLQSLSQNIVEVDY